MSATSSSSIPTSRKGRKLRRLPRRPLAPLRLADLAKPELRERLRLVWTDPLALDPAKKANAVTLASRGNDADLKKAQQEIRTFHGRLCAVRVLDPACGFGNFLYGALEQMKRLEGEIITLLHDLGDKTDYLNLQGSTVDPHQFLGI